MSVCVWFMMITSDMLLLPFGYMSPAYTEARRKTSSYHGQRRAAPKCLWWFLHTIWQQREKQVDAELMQVWILYYVLLCRCESIDEWETVMSGKTTEAWEQCQEERRKWYKERWKETMDDESNCVVKAWVSHAFNVINTFQTIFTYL